MQPTMLERIGIAIGILGLVGFVVAAWFVSPLLALVLSSAVLCAAGTLLVILALRIEGRVPAKQTRAEEHA